jgi:2-polyprenyl-3-methyl-5-hydroxy-6-metoxy-1,4-benzoquinol methylase
MADQGSEGLMSPFLRSQRLAAARPYLRGRVLDVGCGTGALTRYVPKELYMGFDPDPESILLARTNHPGYRFDTSMPFEQRGFDTIASLAVVEHIADRVEFIRGLRLQLREGSASRIVLTTPHQSMEWIHAAGAKLGLFSRQANEEHEELLDERALRHLADQVECRLIRYRRFLLGANQLVILATRK